MSPDLNRTEHVWDILDGRIRKRPAAPLTQQELVEALSKNVKIFRRMH
jgi:transposase